MIAKCLKKILGRTLIGTCWCTLVHAGAHWYMLVHICTCWCTLVHAGTHLYMLVHIGTYWYCYATFCPLYASPPRGRTVVNQDRFCASGISDLQMKPD